MVRRRWFSDQFEDPFEEEFLIPSWDAVERCLEPLIEIQEKENEIVLTADLPCVASREDIRVNVGEDSVEIFATLKRGLKWERWGTFHKKIEFNSFKRFIRLSSRVDPGGSKATFKNGILKIVMTKVTKSTRIKIS